MEKKRFSSGENGFVERRHLFFGQRRSVVEARKNIFTCDGGKSGQERFNTVAVGKHADDLVNGNARAANAGLAVADSWVNGNALVYVSKMAEANASFKRAETRHNRLACLNHRRR